MRGLLFTFTLLLILFGFSANGYAVLQDSTLFKVVVKESDQTTKWEYHYPFNYVFSKEKHEMKGLQAKQEVTKLFEELPIRKDITAEELAKTLEAKGFSSIERMAVYWQGKEDQLYTWVWERK